MKKEYRVKKNEDFSRIIKRKQSMANRTFIIYYLKNDIGHARIGISVSKKLGKAVIRNK
ncbi:ribonuclease P protein component, partial [Thomasclavelia spiroformis]